jgi:hypothetical protein
MHQQRNQVAVERLQRKTCTPQLLLCLRFLCADLCICAAVDFVNLCWPFAVFRLAARTAQWCQAVAVGGVTWCCAWCLQQTTCTGSWCVAAAPLVILHGQTRVHVQIAAKRWRLNPERWFPLK